MWYSVHTKQLLVEDISCQFTSILGFLASEDTSSAARLTIRKAEQVYYFTAQSPFRYYTNFPRFTRNRKHMKIVAAIADNRNVLS